MPTLVLLPGLYGTGELFGPLLEHVESAIVVPLPQDPEATWDTLVEHARAALPGGDYVIVGESFSGPLSIALAARRPPGCVGLVLVATFCRFPLPAGKAVIRTVAPWISGPPPRPVLRRILTGPETPESVVEHVVTSHEENGPGVMARRLELITQVDVCDELAAIEVPILYLRPTEDRLVRGHNLALIRKIRPDVQVVEVPGPHLILQTRPAECAAAIEAAFG